MGNHIYLDTDITVNRGSLLKKYKMHKLCVEMTKPNSCNLYICFT